jgi:hypothetical protein
MIQTSIFFKNCDFEMFYFLDVSVEFQLSYFQTLAIYFLLINRVVFIGRQNYFNTLYFGPLKLPKRASLSLRIAISKCTTFFKILWNINRHVSILNNNKGCFAFHFTCTLSPRLSSRKWKYWTQCSRQWLSAHYFRPIIITVRKALQAPVQIIWKLTRWF